MGWTVSGSLDFLLVQTAFTEEGTPESPNVFQMYLCLMSNTKKKQATKWQERDKESPSLTYVTRQQCKTFQVWNATQELGTTVRFMSGSGVQNRFAWNLSELSTQRSDKPKQANFTTNSQWKENCSGLWTILSLKVLLVEAQQGGSQPPFGSSFPKCSELTLICIRFAGTTSDID